MDGSSSFFSLPSRVHLPFPDEACKISLLIVWPSVSHFLPLLGASEVPQRSLAELNPEQHLRGQILGAGG